MSNNIAYFQNREIVGADASTFQELGDRWAKDKNAVYQEGQKQTYLDSATVKVFPYVYVVDKAGVWVYGTGYYMRVDKTDADPVTFSVISHGYGKDKSHVYFAGAVMERADVATFALVKEDVATNEYGTVYGKDKNRVYFGGEIIEGVSSASCTVESIENCNFNP